MRWDGFAIGATYKEIIEMLISSKKAQYSPFKYGFIRINLIRARALSWIKDNLS